MQIDLRKYGHANGNYMSKCHECKETFIGDKRAITCLECATIMYDNRDKDLFEVVGIKL